MTRLTLICHASTAATRANRFPADEPLDPRALRRLARFPPLRHGAAARRRTSPALRAVQTAAALRLDAAVDPLLRDIDHGRWAGLALSDVASLDPEGFGAWLGDPASAPHGGESVGALLGRVASWLDGQNGPGPVVAVTHAAVIRAAVVHAVGGPPRAFWRVDAGPLSVAVLSGEPGRWTVQSLGRPALPGHVLPV